MRPDVGPLVTLGRSWRPGRVRHGHDPTAIGTLTRLGTPFGPDFQAPAARAMEPQVAIVDLSTSLEWRRAAANPDLRPTPGAGQPVRIAGAYLQRLATPAGHTSHLRALFHPKREQTIAGHPGIIDRLPPRACGVRGRSADFYFF